MLAGVLDDRHPRLHGLVKALRRPRLQRGRGVRYGFLQQRDRLLLGFVIRRIEFVPLDLFAAPGFGGKNVAGSDVHDHRAERAHLRAQLVTVFVRREVLGHIQHLAIDVRENSGDLRSRRFLLLGPDGRRQNRHCGNRCVTC